MLGKRKGAPGGSRPALQTGMRPHAAQTAADLMRIWTSARESGEAPRAARGAQEPSGHMHGAGADAYLPGSEEEGESTASLPKRQRCSSGGEQARATADGCPKLAKQEPSVPGQAISSAAGPLRPRRARTTAATAASGGQRRPSAAAFASAAAAGGAGRLAPADRLLSPVSPQQQDNGAKAKAEMAWLHRRKQSAQVRLTQAALPLEHCTPAQLSRLDCMYAVLLFGTTLLALSRQ